MKSTESQKEKVEVLQGLRAIAFLLIYISHCDIVRNKYGINMFTWLGALGVSVFLMLSGYLKGYSYLMNNSNSSNYFSVLVKKVKKVCPLHMITLIMSLPLSIEFLFSVKGVLCLGINVLMLQSYIPYLFSYNAVSWYLGVFILCVAITPIVEMILSKIRDKKAFCFLPFLYYFCYSF